MILTGSEICECAQDERIIISPFNREQINPNSYNVRLGDTLVVYTKPLDMKKKNPVKKIKITDKGFTLQPGVLYLGHTIEVIGSDEFVPIIDGRSSTGRLGLNIHATAGYGDLGFKGTFTLELSVVQPLVIYPGVEIGQVRFQMVVGDIIRLYAGKYRNQTLPKPSGMWRDWLK